MQAKKHRTKQTSLFFLTFVMPLLIGISFLILFGTAPQTETNGQSPNKEMTTAPSPTAKNQPKRKKSGTRRRNRFSKRDFVRQNYRLS